MSRFKGQRVPSRLFGLINTDTDIPRFDDQLLTLPSFDHKDILSPWAISPSIFSRHILLQTRHPQWFISVVPRLPSYTVRPEFADRAMALFREFWYQIVETAIQHEATIWIVIEDNKRIPTSFIASLRFDNSTRFRRYSEQDWQRNIYVSSLADLQELAHIL